MKLNFLSKKKNEKITEEKTNRSDTITKEEIDYIPIEEKIKQLKKRREKLLGPKVESNDTIIDENKILKKTL